MHYEQRWEQGRSRWIHRQDTFDPRKYDVEVIEQREAKPFVLEHHYSGSFPAARLSVGLFRRGVLVGVAVYSVPSTQRVIPCYTEYEPDEGVELGRYVLLDEVGFNAESWFWARARTLLVETIPALNVLLAYSDPIPRTTLSGVPVMPGHKGTIYQATNASYQGRGSARTLLLDASGRTISERALSKIRNQESGHEYAVKILEEASGTVRHHGESWRAWVTRARRELRRLKHPGNHVYLWGLKKRARIPRSRAYPKSIDPVQLGLL